MSSDIEFVKLAAFPHYCIARSGVVKCIKTGMVVEPTLNNRGTLCVALKNKGGTVKPAVARLVLITFAPALPDWQHQFASVNYLDGDWTNVGIDNLEWDFTTYVPPRVPGVNATVTEFFKIPEFSSYEINGLGHVRFRASRLFETPSSIGGYVMYLLTDDYGTAKPVGVHRLLALAFLEHPIDTSLLVINHKNGVTWDNRLDNLEWTTYTGNILHAYASGMRTQNRPVLAMSLKTGEVEEFFSVGDFYRQKDLLDTGALWFRLRNESPIRPYMGYLVKYKDDLRPWPDLNVILSRQGGYPEAVLVKSLHTGEELRFASITQAAAHLGVTPGSLNYQASKDTPTPYYGHLVKLARKANEPWPEVVEIPDRQASSPIAITVKNLTTGEITRYPSAKQAADFFGTGSTHILDHAKREPPVPFKGHLIRFDSADLTWPDPDDFGVPYNPPRAVVLTEVSTGIAKEFPTLRQAAAAIAGDGKMIRYHADKETPAEYRGYHIRYAA